MTKTTRSLFLLLTLFLLGGCASSGSQDDRSEKSSARKAAELNTQLGREYMSRGEYEVALEKLKKAVAAEDDYAPAHTMLAVLYEQIGEEAQAGRHYERAVKSDPDNGDVNNNYGAFLCRSGNASQADRYFEAALEDPFYRTPAVAMTNAGSCALGRGDLDAADQYLRQALSYDPQFSDALLSLSALNYEQGEYLRSRAFLQRYEISGEPSVDSLMLGYRIESELQNDREATRYRNQIIQRFPGTPEATELQGRGTR